MKRKVIPYDKTRRKRHWQMADPPARRPRRLRPVRWLLFLSIGLLLMFGSLGDAAMGLMKGTSHCKVVSVLDGDTVTIWCGGAEFERARLTGFDTPEVFSPQCNAELWQGFRATVALKGALWAAGRIGIFPGRRDRYDRVLARLTVDGLSVGNLLIERGLARPYSGGRRSSWC